MSADWAQKLLAEKFRFHNAQWLEMVQSQQMDDLNAAFYDEDDDEEGLLHDSDILDMDKAELLLSAGANDLDMFSSSEDTPDEIVHEAVESARPARPLSAYRRDNMH